MPTYIRDIYVWPKYLSPHWHSYIMPFVDMWGSATWEEYMTYLCGADRAYHGDTEDWRR